MNTDVEIMPKEDLQEIVGGNIKKICKEKKVNMMKLSEDVGISYEYLRQIVSPKGKKQLSFYSIYKFSKLLDIEIDDLIKNKMS